MRISYGRVRGSGYNARTGNSVSICPGAQKGLTATQKTKKHSPFGKPGVDCPGTNLQKYFVLLLSDLVNSADFWMVYNFSNL